MATSQEKISVYSLADLKNYSDDALPVYLNSISFKQSHILSDVRLALGYSAFAICAATFYWDYKFGFESTKFYTAIAVALYAAINGALTIWIWMVENGVVYVGTNAKGEKITIATSTKKHKPIYHLTVTTQTKSSAPVTTKITKPFTHWFDSAGHFVAAPFHDVLAAAVPIIASADPKAVARLKAKKEAEPVKVDDGKSMEDKWASLLAESEGVSTGNAEPAAKGKRRAKKA